MPGNAARHAWVEDHRHWAGLRLAGPQSSHGTLARAPADPFRRIQVGKMQARGKFIVSLHRGSFPGKHRNRPRKARAEILAQETVRSGKYQATNAGAGAAAGRIRHSLDGERCFLGSKSVFPEALG